MLNVYLALALSVSLAGSQVRGNPPVRPIGPVSPAIARQYADRWHHYYDEGIGVSAVPRPGDRRSIALALAASNAEIFGWLADERNPLFRECLVELQSRKLTYPESAFKRLLVDNSRLAEQVQAVEAIANSPIKNSRLLRLSLEAKSVDVRVEAGVAFASADDRSRPVIRSLYEYPKARHRMSTRRGITDPAALLLKAGEGKSVESLARILDPLDAHGRLLHKGLGETPHGRRYLHSLIGNPKPYWGIRSSAMAEVARVQDRAAIPSLQIAVVDKQPWVRAPAARALEKLRAREALPELKRALKVPPHPLQPTYNVASTIRKVIASLEKSIPK